MIEKKCLIACYGTVAAFFAPPAYAQQATTNPPGTYGSITFDANQVQLQGQTITGLADGAINANSSDAITGSQINEILVTQSHTDQWQTNYILSLQNTANTAAHDIYQMFLQNGVQTHDIFNAQVSANEANQRITLLQGNTTVALAALQLQNTQQQTRIDVLQDDANNAAQGINDLFLANGVQDLGIFNLTVRNNEQDLLIAAANQNAINSAYIDINSTGGVAAVATGNNAVAFGNGAVAAHDNSVAIGAGSTTTADNQVNVGGRTVSGVAEGALTTTSTDAVNGAQLSATNTRVAGVETGLQSVGSSLSATNDRVAGLESGLRVVDARLNTLEQLAIGVKGDLRRLDNKLKGSTALAIAMSGNAFLPSNSINITGNVGTFDGAFAGSLQVGAMVSPHAAFNAGVAVNFNKKGGVGGRAGFTVGW